MYEQHEDKGAALTFTLHVNSVDLSRRHRVASLRSHAGHVTAAGHR